MPEFERKICPELFQGLKGKSFIILGMGNLLRGDDGVGVVLARELSRVLGSEKVWEVGVVLENYLGRLVKIKPDVVIIIDSMDLGKNPGEIGWFFGEEISGRTVSTHSLSLAQLEEFLAASGIKIRLVIGIQPKSMRLGEGLNLEIREAKDVLMELLVKTFQEEEIGAF